MLRKAELCDLSSIKNLMDSYVIPTWSEDNIKKALTRDENVFLVLEDNGIKGYVCFEKIFDEAELTSIAVEKNFRNRGCGKLLLERGIECLSGVNKFFLEVSEDNTAAISLYEKCGFNRINVRNNYYGDKNAIIMEMDRTTNVR